MKNLQIIRRYFQVTKADRKISVFLVLSSIMANGPYLFVSLLFSMAIDSLSKGDANRVMLMMVIYFLLKICSKVFKTISLMVERRLYNDVYRKLQDQMVEKLDRIEMTAFAVCNKGELLNLVNGDVEFWKNSELGFQRPFCWCSPLQFLSSFWRKLVWG